MSEVGARKIKIRTKTLPIKLILCVCCLHVGGHLLGVVSFSS